jgi:uncharacterized surface protein with fasciclin (FAS1) repeats
MTKTLSMLAAAAMLAAPAAASAQMVTKDRPANTIAQVAAQNGNFKTLVAALQAAGLVETLQGPGPFTVFAPTDAAFAKLPAGTVEALLADREALTAILTYHVVPGKVMAGDIVRMNGAKPATVNGAALDVVVRGGGVFVNGARVTGADVGASNGVIHVIDTVLLPSAAAGNQ